METLHRSSSRFILPLICVLLIVGCKQTKSDLAVEEPKKEAKVELTMDGSNMETFRSSMSRIAESLPPEKRKPFREAVAAVTINNMDLGAAVKAKAAGVQDSSAMQKAFKVLNGKNADEIMAMAEQMRNQRAAVQAFRNRPAPYNGPVPLKPAGQPAAPAGAPAPQA